MATNLIALAQSYLTPEVIQRASALVGESPASTVRALETAAPSVVLELADRASSVPGAENVMGILADAGLDGARGPIAERLGGMSGDDLVQLGKDLLGRLFGARLGPVVDATAASSGVKSSAMSSLLGLATPIVLGVLGHQVQARHLDAAGLVSLLTEQKSLAASALPATVGAALGATSARPPPPRPLPRAVPPPEPHPGRGRLWPLVLVPLIILGAILLRRREAPTTPSVPSRGLGAGITSETPAAETPRPREATPPTEPAPLLRPAPEPAQESAGAPTPAPAPVMSELTEYLEGAGGAPSRRFAFDDLRFEFGTTNLTPSSLVTLDGLARVLASHPAAQLVVEGHTDDIGLPAANERLSLQRAEAVKNALIARGVTLGEITTRGLGQEQPMASNDTPDGRARNRRIELVVTR